MLLAAAQLLFLAIGFAALRPANAPTGRLDLFRAMGLPSSEPGLPDAPLTLADISIGEGEPGGEMSFDILWARAANFRQAFRRLLPERLHRFPGIAEPAALMPDSTAAEIAEYELTHVDNPITMQKEHKLTMLTSGSASCAGSASRAGSASSTRSATRR